MSFLNPVSLPVKRFKSTDADAPQINYNARTAGDVKAVLKACLVTGYGATDSAGWSIVNEVDNVCEFVSPSAAMSDYRLGIDDTIASSTTWYYQYQDVRTDPSYNKPVRSLIYIDKLHASNGWQLLVTERGVVFIELVQNTTVNKLSARITYWGQVKSGISDGAGKNICFFNIGHHGAISLPAYFYDSNPYVHLNLLTYTKALMSAATSNSLSAALTLLDQSDIDLVSQIYLSHSGKSLVIGLFPPMLSKAVNKSSDMYEVNEIALDGRNMLSVCAGYVASDLPTSYGASRTFLIYLDYWEY